MDWRRSKNFYGLVVIGWLSIVIICVATVLILFLLTLPASGPPLPPTRRQTYPDLPAALPTTDAPLEVRFVAKEPIMGYSDCNHFGVNGLVQNQQGQPVSGVQVTVWAGKAGELVALDTTGVDGVYHIELDGQPRDHDLQVQVYQNDRPVSEPVLVKIYVDCQSGFQLYQIDWREIARLQ